MSQLKQSAVQQKIGELISAEQKQFYHEKLTCAVISYNFTTLATGSIECVN